MEREILSTAHTGFAQVDCKIELAAKVKTWSKTTTAADPKVPK